MAIYFTSDLHFGHDKEFLYQPRGFSSIQEHDKTIIENWNSLISDEDQIYVLGDLMLGKDKEYGINCIKQLKGQLFIYRGNHDTDSKCTLYIDKLPNLHSASHIPAFIPFADVIKYGKYQFYLSHYPTAIGNYDDEERHNKFYCLCGHTHTADRWKDFHTMKCYHVELDAHNNYPVSIDEIIDDIRTQNNFDIKN